MSTFWKRISGACLCARRSALIAAGLSLTAAAPAAAGPGPVVARISFGPARHAPVHHAGRAAASCDAADDMPSASNTAAIRGATLCLLNQERTSRGLRRLRDNSRLESAAQSHSDDMVARRYFEHDSPGGSTMVDRIKRTGYVRPNAGWSLGENIAWGTQVLATPRETVKAWMNSPPHRANILRGSFKEIGIGIADDAPVSGTGGQPGATYTTDFGAIS
jgi:uncharacterized protein YkwD